MSDDFPIPGAPTNMMGVWSLASMMRAYCLANCLGVIVGPLGCWGCGFAVLMGHDVQTEAGRFAHHRRAFGQDAFDNRLRHIGVLQQCHPNKPVFRRFAELVEQFGN